MKTNISLILSLTLIAGIAKAQFTLSGEIRPRTEYAHGYKTLAFTDQEPALFTSQRSRLNFLYSDSSYNLYICLQDVRTWGSVPQMTSTDGNTTTIHEAWGDINLNEKWGLKLGRQEIALDDQRIFGSVGWAQQARSHDAAILHYKNADKKVKLQLSAAYNQNANNLTGNAYAMPGSYKTFQYLWLSKEIKSVNISLLALNLGKDVIRPLSHRTVFSQTVGTRVSYKKDKGSVNAAYYHQLGKVGDLMGRDLNAQLISLDGTLNLSKKIATTVGYEYMSGQSQTEEIADGEYGNTLRSFSPFFGTNHKFNGFMDYFYVGNHSNSVGLLDINANLKYKSGKFSMALMPHIFNSAANIIDGAGASADNYLGTEIDFTIGYKLSKNIMFNAGYSQLFASESMEILKGGDSDHGQNWGWAMLTFKPKFFSTTLE